MEYNEQTSQLIFQTAKNADRDKKGKTTAGKIIRGGQKTAAGVAGTAAGTAAGAAAAGAAGSALAGAGLGAAAGSVVPVVGTIVGAVVGAAVTYVGIKYSDELNRAVNNIIGRKEKAEKTGYELYELYLYYVSNNPEEKRRIITFFNTADKSKIDKVVRGLKQAAANPNVANFYFYFFIGVRAYLWDKFLTRKGKENAVYFWNRLTGQRLTVEKIDGKVFTTEEPNSILELII